MATLMVAIVRNSTQVISSAIMGVGSEERVSKVHWIVARQIVVAWLVTIPFAALLGASLASQFDEMVLISALT